MKNQKLYIIGGLVLIALGLAIYGFVAMRGEDADNIMDGATAVSTTTTGMMTGNDRDAHGCIGSAGYSWSEVKGACIRPWEENQATTSGTGVNSAEVNINSNINTPMPGSDRDAHGCIGSAGYSWSEAKGACVRSWENQ